MYKSTIFLIFCCFLTIKGFSQEGIYWSAPIEVAPASFDDKSPKIDLLSDGTPVVIWGKGNTIYFSRMNNGSFIDPVEMNTNGISPDIYNFGGLDLVTFDDYIFMVYEDFATGVHLIRSDDGGFTFELPVSVFDPPSGIWATLPSVGTDDQGNPLVSVLRELSNETQARYVLMRSDDGGATFGQPVVASEPADGEYVCECCPSDIYSIGDDVFLVFRNNNNNQRDMWVSLSSDGGLTFNEATDVDDTDWVINACPISGPKITPMSEDSLITAWKSGASGNSRVSFSTLHAGTLEKGWEYALPQINNNSNQEMPDIAGSNDTIGIVWQESGFGTNSSDLLFAFSKTGADGLIDNFSNITNAPGVQRNPSLAYYSGFFHLVYSDASGAVLYRKGTISEVNATLDQSNAALPLQLMTQPITGNRVILNYHGEDTRAMELTLTNLAGQAFRQIKMDQVYPGQPITFDTGTVTSGVYLLQARSGNQFWSSKLLIR